MKLIAFLLVVVAAVTAATLGGVFREGEAASASLQPEEAHRIAVEGLLLQQRARVTGDPAFYPRAERVLNEALEVDPKNAMALRGLAAVAASRHRFNESLELARRAERIQPDIAEVHGLIGDASLELGRYDQAFAAFDRMVALRPSASAYARISYARELIGDIDGAIDAMELAVDSAGIGEPAAWSRTLTGNLLLGDRKIEAASIRYREALEFVPEYAGALAGLGDIALARGDLAKALPLYRRAAKSMAVPDYAATLGDLLGRLGRRPEAERAWKRAESLERLFAANGGSNLLETAEFDLNHDRNFRTALDRARRGRAERPSVEGDHVLAWALYKNGLCAEARTVSLRSLRLGTVDVDGLYHHSLIERCLGNDAAAARYLARVEAADPRYLDAPPSPRRLRA
ncbi:MAG: tetratricopeptide repeat protein [Actinomycetota bacterium]|nr:tetratricopeptide repeat protein [Actinomycetota bacterium]